LAEFADYLPTREAIASPPINLVVREAHAEDADAIARLHSDRERLPLNESVEWAGNVIQSARTDNAMLLLAEVGGEVVAYGYAGLMRADGIPKGFYLLGLVVDLRYRRQGIGHAITAARMDWIRERAEVAYYFANELNGATIDLHAAFGFREVRRGVSIPGVTFRGGVGVLYESQTRQLAN
jgi:ribosomal protein S18 acetylase RimI-like enzyme